MELSTNLLMQELEAPSKAPILRKARTHQRRLRFHTETKVSKDSSEALTLFLQMVDGLLPREKQGIFRQMLTFPLATNNVAAACFDKLHRVMDGRNPVFSYQFTKADLNDDWEVYRQQIGGQTIWRTKGWERLKYDINSVLVVDLPREQTDARPSPYFYWLPIDNVISFDAGDDNVMRWIIFKDGNDIVVIDGVSYRRFAKQDKSLVLVSEAPHDLGYCPCRFFWSEALNSESNDIKASPLSKVLGELDWFLFFYVSKMNLDLYAGYPVVWAYEESCDYMDKDRNVCRHGTLVSREGITLLDADGNVMKCPKCGRSHLAGAGTVIKVPIPHEGMPDLGNQPVNMLTVDRNSLDYNVAEIERLKANIIAAVVGNDTEVNKTQAINEKQVLSAFESQDVILQRIKRNFEAAQRFVEETICRLRYGDMFTSLSINWGTEFYIATTEDLREKYERARTLGASEAELDALRQQILETEYRNDPVMMQRMLILSQIEPYRHMSNADVVNLYLQGIVAKDDLLLKLNFSNFVSRFERENMNILTFGAGMSFAQKIDKITKILREYGTEGTTGRRDSEEL